MSSDEGNRDETSRLRAGPSESIRAYLELVRLPNLFSATADVAMGFFFVQALSGPHDGWTLGLLAAASGLLYAAGVVLNDVFDFEIDRVERPQRPLPSGRVARSGARSLGWTLLVLGVAAGWLVAVLAGRLGPAVVATLLAGCIVLYDALLKRTPVGPVAMGGCRMLNVLLGMSVGGVAPGAEPWLVAGGIGTYIAGLTWFARTEAGPSRRPALLLAIGVMAAGVLMLACFPSVGHGLGPGMLFRWHLLILVLGLLIARRMVHAVFDPTPRRVQLAVTQGILSLVILDASVCYAVRGLTEAVGILLLLIPAMGLARWIPLT